MLQKSALILLNTETYYMLPCMNKRLTGIDCPGCGFQRSVLLLFKGEFLAAFKMYPAIYPILAFVLFLIFNSLIKFKYGHQIRLFLMLTVAGTVAISYIIKMNHFFS